MISMKYFIFFIICVFIVALLRFFLTKNLFLLDNYKFSKHKNITNKKKFELGPPLCGGLTIFFVFFFDSSLVHLNLFVFFILSVGILSDSNILTSPKLRIFLQIAIVLPFVILFDLRVFDLRSVYINNLLEIYYVSIFFSSFCILVLINGTNFIDGLNTLVLGYYIMVVTILIFLASKFNLLLDEKIILFLIILIVLFIFNFNQKIFLGDSGSYVIAFVMSFFILNFTISNQIVSPFFICLLLWYPALENLFSILRRSFSNKKSSHADKFHLHHFLFFFVSKKYKLSSKKLNTFSGLLLNLFNLLIFIISFNYYNRTSFLILLLLFSILTYLVSYYLLRKFYYSQVYRK